MSQNSTGVLFNIKHLIERLILRLNHQRPLQVGSKILVSRYRPYAELVAQILGSYSTHVIDVGARWGGGGAWWRLHPIAKLIGFEPDASECARLNTQVVPDNHETYVPLGLGRSSRTATLYVTQEPACSSLYEPDPTVVPYFKDMESLVVKKKLEVPLVPLDDWWEKSGKPSIEFIKIDTQGSELDVLSGGKNCLAQVLGVEVEVEFNTMYRDQPLFSDVDIFLRQQGFVLWRLGEMCHYAESPQKIFNRTEQFCYDGRWETVPAGNGRLFWANALYFRDYRKLPPSLHNWRKLLMLSALYDAASDSDAREHSLQYLVQNAELLGLPQGTIDRLSNFGLKAGKQPST